MDTLTQAQTAWQADFNRLLCHVQEAYHLAENAQDRRRTNTKAEEERELSHRATVKADAHTDAVRHLTEWVKARPYPATDQTAPTQAQTVADSMREVNRLANLADEKQQYRNGWNGAMEAVEDVRSTSQDARAWAERLRSGIEMPDLHRADTYAKGTSDALTHFLQTGQTDRHAP
jgi:hypothetical protein